MKARFRFLLAAAVLAGALAAALVAACSAPASQARPNEEIYGSWLGERPGQDRLVIAAGEIKQIASADDPQLFNTRTQVITARWTDSEGSLWYKAASTVIRGPSRLMGSKWQSLSRVSKSAATLEIMSIPVRDFDPKGYPEKLDPESEYYAVYVRDSRAAFPHAVLYGDAWK